MRWKVSDVCCKRMETQTPCIELDRAKYDECLAFVTGVTVVPWRRMDINMTSVIVLQSVPALSNSACPSPSLASPSLATGEDRV